MGFFLFNKKVTKKMLNQGTKSLKILQNVFTSLRNINQVRHFRVTVIGGAGRTSQSLSMFLKMNPLVTVLNLYDVRPEIQGLACDLSLVDTKTKVEGFTGKQIDFALERADLVIMIAGVSREVKNTPCEVYCRNAKIVYEVAENIAKYAPKAILAMVTNPINCLVPLAAEVLERLGKGGPTGCAKVLGMTTLNSMRAAKLISEINDISAKEVTVPIIGGNDGNTIIPVLSQCKPPLKVTRPSMIVEVTKQIQGAGFEILKRNVCTGAGTTLSTAYATARFSDALLRGLAGQSGIIESAFVKSEKTEAPFFANPVLLGKDGVMENLGYGVLSKYEQELVEIAVPILIKQAKEGKKFVLNELGYV